MKKLLCILFFGCIILSCKKDGSTLPQPVIPQLVVDSLEELTSDIPTADYTDLFFVTATTGYAISNDGLIIKTTDGGFHWQQLATVNAYLHRIQFVDRQTGFIIGGDLSKAFLFKTNDAGVTWHRTELATPLSYWPNGMFFHNSTTGFITGQKLFRKTTDGGTTWTDLVMAGDDNFGDVRFKNKNEGYATSSMGRYYKTTNGGNSWTPIQLNSTEPLLGIFLSPAKVYGKLGAGSLVDLAAGNVIASVPTAVQRLLFLTNDKCVGIGQHYDNGFWPYGDIFLTNNNWVSFDSQKYEFSKAMTFTAIAKTDDHHTIMLGRGQLQTTVVRLKH